MLAREDVDFISASGPETYKHHFKTFDDDVSHPSVALRAMFAERRFNVLIVLTICFNVVFVMFGSQIQSGRTSLCSPPCDES